MTEPTFEAALTADIRAEVTHPDRDLTQAERAFLGLSEEETT